MIGKLISQFSTRLPGEEGSFLSGIAIDNYGNLVISDYGTNRISTFTVTGECLRTFGTHGEAPGQLSKPSGLAIGLDDNIYVTESGNHRLQVC